MRIWVYEFQLPTWLGLIISKSLFCLLELLHVAKHYTPTILIKPTLHGEPNGTHTHEPIARACSCMSYLSSVILLHIEILRMLTLGCCAECINTLDAFVYTGVLRYLYAQDDQKGAARADKTLTNDAELCLRAHDLLEHMKSACRA